jgi:hypothetical protein
VGAALEYAVKARETYEKVAEHGEQTVRTWRGVPDEDQDHDDAGSGTAVTAGRRPGPVAVPDEDEHGGAGDGESGDAPSGAAGTSRAGRKTAKPTTPRRTVTRKTTVRRNGTSTRKADPSEEE